MTTADLSALPPDRIAQRIRTGLIGRGILASGSPFLHEQEGRALGLDLTYELIDFDARGWPDAALPAVLARLADSGHAGCNITYPFKQAVLPLIDVIDDSARLVGAVNTVVFREGRMFGHNTDMEGFRDSFRQHLGDVPRGRVLLLGAGGAGGAVATALLLEGVGELILFDADTARARSLAMRLGPDFPEAVITVSNSVREAAEGVDGIVNATPVGMASHPGTPLPPACLCARHWLADIIYFPRETELLRQARARGCRVMDGVGMVVGQAARAFTLMTGHPADAVRMAQSALRFGDEAALAGRV